MINYNNAQDHLSLENINQALQNLNDDYRRPFVMHHEGYEYQEIADELLLPLGTVKSRIFFARKMLKKDLLV